MRVLQRRCAPLPEEDHDGGHGLDCVRAAHGSVRPQILSGGPARKTQNAKEVLMNKQVKDKWTSWPAMTSKEWDIIWTDTKLLCKN